MSDARTLRTMVDKRGRVFVAGGVLPFAPNVTVSGIRRNGNYVTVSLERSSAERLPPILMHVDDLVVAE